MTQLPKLTEADIRHWVGETSFQRGQSHASGNAILHPHCQGNLIKAQCQGSSYAPYRVQAALGPGGIISSDCSCPVGSGRCKHVAALLLAWLRRPEEFTEIADLETNLAQRSPAELIALIRQMVERYPDLELLLELPTPAPAGAQPPLDAQAIRRQARQAFRGDRAGWVDPFEAGADLQPLLNLAAGYVAQQNWRDAVTVYEVIIRETLDNYEMVHEEAGELSEIVNDSVSGLGECLEATTDPALRQAILRVLVDTYLWDVNFGGIDMGYEADDLILCHTNPGERRLVIEWLQAALPSGDSWSADYHRQRLGGFLLALQGDTLDAAAFIALCRQTGRLNDLVDRLLDLGRLDEATAEARQAEDYPLLQLAPLFEAHSQGDRVEQIIRERLSTSKDRRLPEWLKARLIARNDLAGALPLEEQQLWQSPTPDAYQKLRELAQKAGRWDSLRADILIRLEQEKKYGLLTEIHLLEKDVAAALQTLSLVQKQPLGWGYYTATGGPLSIRVAQAAEASHPRQALELYLAQVKHLIDSRGRENYATAARYLRRIQALYQSLNEVKTWEKLIADIYQNHRQLRALKEELAKVGL